MQLELKRSVQVNQDPAIQSVDLENRPIEPVIRNDADQPARALSWLLTEINAIQHAGFLVVDWDYSCCDHESARLYPTRDTGRGL